MCTCPCLRGHRTAASGWSQAVAAPLQWLAMGGCSALRADNRELGSALPGCSQWRRARRSWSPGPGIPRSTPGWPRGLCTACSPCRRARCSRAPGQAGKRGEAASGKQTGRQAGGQVGSGGQAGRPASLRSPSPLPRDWVWIKAARFLITGNRTFGAGCKVPCTSPGGRWNGELGARIKQVHRTLSPFHAGRLSIFPHRHTAGSVLPCKGGIRPQSGRSRCGTP